MPRTLWPENDQKLLKGWWEGKTYLQLSIDVGCSPRAILGRVQRLRLPPRSTQYVRSMGSVAKSRAEVPAPTPMDRKGAGREPIPAMHPISWSCLEGCLQDARAERIILGKVAALIVLLVMSVSPLRAYAVGPAPGTEDFLLMEPYKEWITGLSVEGALCCSLADGRPVLARIFNGVWQVKWRPGQLEGAPVVWTDVPTKAVSRSSNPMGVPVAWWYGGVVRCFAPAGGI